jgi:predicted GNAT family acetyltransferase
MEYNNFMKTINPNNAENFLEITWNILEEDEINSNLILGICNNLIKNKHHYGNEDPFYSVVYNDNNIIQLLGLMTLPHKLNIYEYKKSNNGAIDMFTKNIYSKYTKINGVSGEINIAKAFAKKWVEIKGCQCELDMELRLFKLTKVNPYNRPDGIFRKAIYGDVETLTEFMRQFSKDINEPENDIEKTRKNCENIIKNEEFYVWETSNKIVSMARKARPTKNGTAINRVYTPIEFRKKGYATACVSELSQNILNSGKKYCILSADLANPISNSIYQKIGYKPVNDYIRYKFKE